jgi:transmembrane sensor
MRNWLPHGSRDRLRMRAASTWLLRLREEELSAKQISAWLRWSHAHPGNLEAYDDVKSLLHRVRGLDAEQKSMALRRLTSERRQPDSPSRWLLAAALVTVAVALGFLTWRYRSQPEQFEATYTTSKAQERRFKLPDGTGIELGADSRLAVVLTPRVRMLELIEGEAFFHVKHDEGRRFVVRTGKWQLTDVGTAFNVRKTNEHVVLTVAEGVVDVAKKPSTDAVSGTVMDEQSSHPMRLLAGEQAIMDATEDSLRLAKIESTAASSWEQGQLRFKDEPLSVVLANLNRYSKYEIVMADPGIGTMRFSGTVLVDNLDGWLAAACRVFLLREQRGPDNELLLYRQVQTDK